MMFENRCAHCGETIFRYGTKDPWMHRRTESAWCGKDNIAEPDEGFQLGSASENSHLGRREQRRG